MRTIASAKRLCERYGARCTIAWDWGDYDDLFDDDTEWIPYSAHADANNDFSIPGYHRIRHSYIKKGRFRADWRIPVTKYPRIIVSSCFVFYAAEERPPRRNATCEEQNVFAWFPRPHKSIMKNVNEFRNEFIPPRTVGLHIRRTDNIGTILRSPDEVFFRKADRFVDAGYHVFLGTDNQETLRLYSRRYGTKLICHQKTSTMENRWPRCWSNAQEGIDDMMDLLLLASCEFVIASRGSSFSRTAILLNGSPLCETVNNPLGMMRYMWLRAGLLINKGCRKVFDR